MTSTTRPLGTLLAAAVLTAATACSTAGASGDTVEVVVGYSSVPPVGGRHDAAREDGSDR
ncbi:hypothetical protein [Kitasatospora camelliae]|uniref:Substrate-binding family protein n=1 Tax=Kitasatospora camelliae TaxID=3156397 RepID=A0AAU8JTD0_9ACTN